jgi:hypothetical protein
MREQVRIRVDALKDNMAFGGGVPTFEAYRELVGQVRGLYEAIEILDEAERIIEERERGR